MNEIGEVLLDILVFSAVGALFIAGLGVTVIGMPGVWLVFAGIFISALHTGFEEITILELVLFALIALLVSFVDNLIIPYSTKYTGGSRYAVMGALAGGFLGLLIGSTLGAFMTPILGGLIGAIVGPFIGAVAFEYIFGKSEFRKSLKAGSGAFGGFILTVFVKFGASVAMIIMWAITRF